MKNLFDKDLDIPLAKSIRTEYLRFIDQIEKINPEDRKKKKFDGTGGRVSVCDLIAYQIGWGKLLIYWYESGIKNEIIQMPGEGFSKWDYTGLAKLFYKKYFANQLEILQETFFRIVEIVEYEFQTGNLKKEGIWAWCQLSSGKQWPLEKWIRVNTISPLKRHTALIKKFYF